MHSTGKPIDGGPDYPRSILTLMVKAINPVSDYPDEFIQTGFSYLNTLVRGGQNSQSSQVLVSSQNWRLRHCQVTCAYLEENCRGLRPWGYLEEAESLENDLRETGAIDRSCPLHQPS